LTQIAGLVRSALDWDAAQGSAHGIAGPVIIFGWSGDRHPRLGLVEGLDLAFLHP
jgi:hypothetical protein